MRQDNPLNHLYRKAVFLKSAPKMTHLPEDVGYEVAFAGRSNAGKSSALNCLTGIHQLARTSKTPGRTQLINLFSLDEERRLCDLPGYGYAKVSQSVKLEWQKNLAEYLEKRKCLKGLILLMDIRHPNQPLDDTMLQWAIHRNLPIHILLTKADKLSQSQAKSTLIQVQKKLSVFEPLVSVQTFSSLKKQGIESLVNKLDAWFELQPI